jgi:glucan biosynthesis protein C
MPPDEKPQRLLYIDNIRWLMIVLVIVVHSNVIYGPVGQFFGYEDRANSGDMSDILFTLISVLIQAFFMGLLFLIAGYFVPKSLERKGDRRFILDRMKRLGIPSLIFIIFLAPAITYPLHFDDTMSFADYALKYYPNPVNWDTGPMWFAVALLLFSIVWAFLPSTWTFERFKGPLTRIRVAILISLVVLGTFLVRIVYPIGTDVWNMQLCFFTQYVAMFVAGILAFKNGWFASLDHKEGRFWGWVAIGSIFAILFPIMILGGSLEGNTDPYSGGLNWQAAGLALFEQVFGISISLWMLVRFKERHNTQTRLTKKISDNAFAVYVFHPPVVIAIAVLLAGYDFPNILKLPILATSATILTFLLAEFVLRRIPGLKSVL